MFYLEKDVLCCRQYDALTDADAHDYIIPF